MATTKAKKQSTKTTAKKAASKKTASGKKRAVRADKIVSAPIGPPPQAPPYDPATTRGAEELAMRQMSERNLQAAKDAATATVSVTQDGQSGDPQPEAEP